MNTEHFWSAIQRKVCVHCIDSDGAGNCRLHPSQKCALESYFPLIVLAVQNVESDRYDDYVNELRAVVCRQCKYGSEVEGECGLRSYTECGLDRYFPLIIEAIEEVKQAGAPTV